MSNEICKVCKLPILPGQPVHGLFGVHYDCAVAIPMRDEVETAAIKVALSQASDHAHQMSVAFGAGDTLPRKQSRQRTLRSGRVEIEADAEKLLVSQVKTLGGKMFKLKFIGADGAPDRIIFMPGGKIYLVELKRAEGGALEDTQEVLFPMIEERGTHIHIVCGILGVQIFVERVLKGNIL